MSEKLFTLCAITTLISFLLGSLFCGLSLAFTSPNHFPYVLGGLFVFFMGISAISFSTIMISGMIGEMKGDVGEEPKTVSVPTTNFSKSTNKIMDFFSNDKDKSDSSCKSCRRG